MTLLHITDKEVFAKEVLQSDKPSLVDFWAPWCGPCKMLGPVIEELASEVDYANIVKVDVDKAGALAADFGIQNIPTIVFVKDGKEAKRLVGLRGKGDLLAALEALK